MVLISWFKEIKNKEPSENQEIMQAFPDHLRKWLLDLLACSDPAFPTKDSVLPYAELSRTFAKMRNEASQLLHALESSGMFVDMLSTMKFNVESISVDDAISFASKVPLICNNNEGNESAGMNIDDIESAKQRLITTSGYLKCVQVHLRFSFRCVICYSKR